jgi:hypothetical protein
LKPFTPRTSRPYHPRRRPGRTAIALAAIVASTTACRKKDVGPPPLDVRTIVDQLLPDVERISALRETGPIHVGLKTAAEVRTFVEQKLDREMPPAELEGTRLTYVMLGLLPADLDLHALLLDLYAEQIAGFYDPETKTLYAVDGVPSNNLLPVLAHELVHALQDQIVNLDSLISGNRSNDRKMAAQAAIEGHATLAMLAWIDEKNTGRSVDVADLPDVAGTMRQSFDAQQSGFPVMARAPRIIRDGLIFPYATGASFVQALWRRPGLPPEPPFGPLMPQSTEQVMQPQSKMFDQFDAPTELRFGPVEGWTVRRDDTLGAFETTIFTEEHVGLYGAGGWDGDRAMLLESGDGRHVLEWASVWDDSTAAARFESTVRQILASPSFGRPGSVSMESIENRPLVRVIIADQPATLEAAPVLEVHCADEQGVAASCEPVPPAGS